MNQPIQLRAEPVRSLAFGSIGASYSAIGSPIATPARMLFLQNLTDATLMFSQNGGLTDHYPLPPNGFLLLDITANQAPDQGYYLQVGSPFAVKRIGTPTTGSVYLSVFFAGASI